MATKSTTKRTTKRTTTSKRTRTASKAPAKAAAKAAKPEQRSHVDYLMVVFAPGIRRQRGRAKTHRTRRQLAKWHDYENRQREAVTDVRRATLRYGEGAEGEVYHGERADQDMSAPLYACRAVKTEAGTLRVVETTNE